MSERYPSIRFDNPQLFIANYLPTLMNSLHTESSDLVTNSVLYKEFLAERDEILRHKWIESEKIGRDIGFEKALLDWILKYRSSWRSNRAKSIRDQNSAPA